MLKRFVAVKMEALNHKIISCYTAFSTKTSTIGYQLLFIAHFQVAKKIFKVQFLLANKDPKIILGVTKFILIGCRICALLIADCMWLQAFLSCMLHCNSNTLCVLCFKSILGQRHIIKFDLTWFVPKTCKWARSIVELIVLNADEKLNNILQVYYSIPIQFTTWVTHLDDHRISVSCLGLNSDW